MREDMAKVLCERPRNGGDGARKGRPLRDGQPMPKSQGLRRAVKERGDWKMLNEHLGPLRRFLQRQVGLPWNKVHSEIRARIKPGNTVQEHILTHVPDFLSRHVRLVTPTAEAPCGVVREPENSVFQSYYRALKPNELYVDPRDGLIKRARRKLKGPRPA